MGSCQSTEANVSSSLNDHSSSKIQKPTDQKIVSSTATAALTAESPGLGVLIGSDTTDNSHESHGNGIVNVELSEMERARDMATSPYAPGYASGGSTPVDSRSLDGSQNGRERANSSGGASKGLKHSTSVLGLDSMKENRKEEGDLTRNIVNIEVPFGKPIEEVYDGVHTGPVLGSGISGLVRLVSHKATGVKYAVKCLDLDLVDSEEGLQQLREEIFIMCQLDHPNIVRLEEVYESHSEIYLVQELCLGGELFDRLDEQPDYHYTEAECARLVKQMLCAIRYLHSKGVVHRDLKLENFLFSSTSPDSELKMIDFGLSKHFKFGQVHTQPVGTPYTVAPEVIRGQYDERCDIWAIAVITFLLLSGDPPFGGCGGPEPLMTVRSNILRGEFQFEPEETWSLVSSQAKDFIRKLLVTDPKYRPTAKQAQTHAWLKEWANKTKTAGDQLLNPNVVKALVSFKEFSDMRKLLCEVLSFTLLPDQIRDLRLEFEKMDTDGSGEISLGALKQVLLTNAGAGSLGALTESEVEDIFNAMRVSKTGTRIHWHEFIAAGLSQCQVDDRNLRLAFDRLDSDHKGYITFENVMDLMGNEAMQSEDAMRRMWGDSMKACNCTHARITYDDFLLLMKGQTRETPDHMVELPVAQMLQVVHETNHDEGKVDMSGVDSILRKSGSCSRLRQSSMSSIRSLSAIGTPPTTPKLIPLISTAHIPDIDTPLSMDEENDVPHRLEGLEPSNLLFLSSSPPQSPRQHQFMGQSSAKPFTPSAGLLSLQSFPAKPPPYTRRRSRSVDDQDPDVDKSEMPSFGSDARRAMMLPEHTHSAGEIETLIRDESKTPLVVNRQLYRAHRQMRLAVLDATKRFDDQQTRKAREILMAQRDDEEEGSGDMGQIGAGLVLRRGLKRQVSSETVSTFLRKKKQENDALVMESNKRGGRGRDRRKKTSSDLSGMLLGLSSDLKVHNGNEKSIRDLKPPAAIKEAISEPFGNDSPGKKMHESDGALLGDSPDLADFPPIRGSTVPGQFKFTSDPFGAGGQYRYGHS